MHLQCNANTLLVHHDKSSRLHPHTSMIYHLLIASSNTKQNKQKPLSNLPLQVSFMIDSIHTTPTTHTIHKRHAYKTWPPS